MLKITGINLELISDIDMLYMINNGIRGGIVLVPSRYARSNNKYMGDVYDSSKLHNS